MNKADIFSKMVSVDSIGRAPGCGPGSWGFESPPTPHMGEGEKEKYAPEVMATKLAPNQQDKVQFLTGVPKDELED